MEARPRCFYVQGGSSMAHSPSSPIGAASPNRSDECRAHWHIMTCVVRLPVPYAGKGGAGTSRPSGGSSSNTGPRRSASGGSGPRPSSSGSGGGGGTAARSQRTPPRQPQQPRGGASADGGPSPARPQTPASVSNHARAVQDSCDPIFPDPKSSETRRQAICLMVSRAACMAALADFGLPRCAAVQAEGQGCRTEYICSLRHVELGVVLPTMSSHKIEYS